MTRAEITRVQDNDHNPAIREATDTIYFTAGEATRVLH